MVPSYIKKIKKGYCHPLYASKLENLNEMEKFLKNFGKSEQSYIKKVNFFSLKEDVRMTQSSII